MFFYIVLAILFIPLTIIFPIRVIGRKNIPRKGRMILALNHQTNNDPVIVAFKLTRRRYRFMAKKALFKFKPFAWILKGLGGFPVNHSGQNDIRAVKTSLNYLKEDKALCIFPEGRRITSDESNTMKNGIVMISLKTKSPIIPACIIKKTNAFVFNTLIVGQPLKLYEMEEFKDKKLTKDILDEASKILGSEIYKLKNDYLDNKRHKKKK